MKHHLSLLFVLCAFCCMSATAQSITLNGVAYDIDTVRMFQAGPGCTHIAVRMLTHEKQDKPLNAFLLRVDATNPYIHFEEMLGKDKLVGTERPSAMAKRRTTSTSIVVGGTNGDFFQTKTENGVGKPIGLTIQNGEYALVGSTSRRLGGFDDQGKAILGTNWSYSGKLVLADTTLKIHHANYNRGDNQLVLFNQYNGTSTNTNQYGTEVLVELKDGEQWKTNGRVHLRVVKKETGVGNMTIPSGKAVLSGHGTMTTELNKLEEGDDVDITFTLKVDDVKMNLLQSVGGDNYALIVHDGKVEQENFWNEVHPRTGFGATMTGDTVLFCVVDGRQVQSQGCTTKVLGEIMRHYGAWNAVNWDGGGSSCLYINQFGQVNNGSDGSERAVGNAMFAIADVPTEDNAISTIRPHDLRIKLPSYAAYRPHFYGYNQYEILLDTDVEGVRLECDKELGTIMEDGRFLVGQKSGYLRASLGEATAKIYVEVTETNDIAFRLDSILLDNRHTYQVEVQSKVKDETVPVPSEVLEWESLTPEVCEVSAEGIIKAIKNGSGKIAGDLQGIRDTLTVHVQNPAAPTRAYNEITAAQFTAPSGFNPQWNGKDIVFNYAITRAPFLAVYQTVPLYGLPDSVRLEITTDAVLSGATLALTKNSDKQSFAKVPLTLPAKTGTISVATPMAAWTGATFDIASYPIWFNELRFTIDTSTPAGSHTITIDGITLC
ncbi:MAG TPA: hypothetical protein DIW30_02495, partial [Bacteroidales bacterium]|nr:hypothetical protein [Bacteroidales bacterium]